MVWLGLALLLAGCEAKLRLEEVDATRQQPIRRSDQFQAAASNAERVVVVATHGVIVTSADQGQSWQRVELEGWPSLMDVAACPDGSFVALAFERQIWLGSPTAEQWTMAKIDSNETPQALTCDSRGRVWVVGSFSTFLVSADKGATWTAQSLEEDLFLTSIQFFDANHAIAVGEFGAVLKTMDGGTTWQNLDPMPEEFYPQDAWFQDPQQGWAVGLRGRVMETADGGATWRLVQTPTLAPLFTLGALNGVPCVVGGDGVVMLRVNGQWQPQSYPDAYHQYLRAMLPLGDKLLVAGGSGALRVLTLSNPQAVQASDVPPLALNQGTP